MSAVSLVFMEILLRVVFRPVGPAHVLGSHLTISTILCILFKCYTFCTISLSKMCAEQQHTRDVIRTLFAQILLDLLSGL